MERGQVQELPVRELVRPHRGDLKEGNGKTEMSVEFAGSSDPEAAGISEKEQEAPEVGAEE